MAQFGNITLTPSKVQQILEAGRRQLSAEEFEELSNLLFDLEIYGFTPWINVRLGTLMSKVQWELELEPSPEWEEALIACDKAFLGRELRDMCEEVGASPVGHKKQLCARLYKRKVPEVVAVMEPYLKGKTPEQIKEEVEQYAKVERLPKIEKEGDLGPKYGLWDSYRDYGAAVREANRLRGIGWKARITEAETPQGKRFHVWVYPARRKIEGHLPYPQTETLWTSKLRQVKDRLEELHRTAPDEFYQHKRLIEQAMRERERGETRTMPEFTLDELNDLLKSAGRLYR